MGSFALLIAGAALTMAPVCADVIVEKPDPARAVAVAMSAAQDVQNEEMLKLSEAFGNYIGKHLNNPLIQFDTEKLVEGFRAGLEGKPAPMSEEECEALLAAAHEKGFQRVSTENLAKANTFLVENSKAPNVVEVEAGKLQYEILAEGTGENVKEHATPQVYYTGRFLDGTIFGSSEGMEEPIAIPLDQTISGFGKGLVGMKEGERRRLYVHPELAYGSDSGQLPPNELLIFDIEIVKADTALDLCEEIAAIEEAESEVEVQASAEGAEAGAVVESTVIPS